MAKKITDHWVVSEECCYKIAKKYGWTLDRVRREIKGGTLPVKCTYLGDCQFPGCED